MNVDDSGKGKQPASKGKEQAFSLIKEIHAAEHTFAGDNNTHVFEVTLEPSSYTEEKFKLFQSYEHHIHNKKKEEPGGFKRFLVESPLRAEPIPYPADPPEHLPRKYGAYHQLYRLDGELIAMGVIDILPYCVSSVYFMWEKRFERYSLGKLSALREASLAKEIHDAGVPDMTSLYMGFYIHSCPKMRYKGDYKPSYLADPEDYAWYPLEKALPLLDKHHYVSFSNPKRSLESRPDPKRPLPPPELSELDLGDVRLLDGVRNGSALTIPLAESPQWENPESKKVLLGFINALGPQLAKEVLLYLRYELEG